VKPGTPGWPLVGGAVTYNIQSLPQGEIYRSLDEVHDELFSFYLRLLLCTVSTAKVRHGRGARVQNIFSEVPSRHVKPVKRLLRHPLLPFKGPFCSYE
jgi:hypothetical protein